MMRKIWQLEKNSKVCAIDLDGVLVDYPKCWVDFINKETEKKFNNLHEVKNNLSYNKYKTLKIKYRTCGIKASLPAIEGASEFIKKLKQAGYKVIILTSRPYRKHREIWSDTTKWLKKNKIDADGIIWEQEKHWAVLREFPYLKFLAEDNAEIANQVARLGYKVYLFDNEYNKQRLEKNCFRVKKLSQIIYNEVEVTDK